MATHENELEPILLELGSKAQRYQDELGELNRRSSSITIKLEQIQAAISALQGSPAGRAASSNTRPKKPVPDRAKVKAVVEGVFKEKGSVKRQALEELVKAQLLAEGYSRLGVTRHLNELVKPQPAATAAESAEKPAE